MSARSLYSVPEPPHEAREIERACVGAILLNPEIVSDVLRIVAREDFYSIPLGRVLDVIRELTGQGVTADLLTVTRALRERGVTMPDGSDVAAWVAALVDGIPKSTHAIDYARAIAPYWDNEAHYRVLARERLEREALRAGR